MEEKGTDTSKPEKKIIKLSLEECIEKIKVMNAYVKSMQARGNENLTQEQIQDVIKVELRLRILKKRAVQASTEFFMENFMYIENKDGVTPDERSILFKLFPAQKKLLKSIEDNKKTIIIKARQLGITWLLLGYGIQQCLKHKQFTVGVLSQTEDYMHEAINRIEYVLERMPIWLMGEYKVENINNYSSYLYEKKSDIVTIYHPLEQGQKERAVSTIKGFISTEKAGRSITADLLIFDEWAYHESAEAVFAAAYPTINRPTSGKFVGLSSNKRGSFFEDVVRSCLDNNDMNFNLQFLGVYSDPRRTVEWYEETKKTLKNTWMQEYPETIEQALSAGEMTAFPEFSPAIHVCEPFEIPAHWKKWFSVDNGYNDPFAWYKAAMSEDGTIYIYYEYTREKGKDDKVHYSDQAKHFMQSCEIDKTDEAVQNINDMRTGYVIPDDFTHKEYENLQYGVFGLDAFSKHHRDQSGKSLMDYYKDGGMFYSAQRAITDRKLRKDIYHEYLKPYKDGITGQYTAKLQIFNTCKFLIKYIPMLVVEEGDGNVVADNSRIDNVYDSTGYLLISSPKQASEPVKKKSDDLEKFKAFKIKQLLGLRKSNKKGVIN